MGSAPGRTRPDPLGARRAIPGTALPALTAVLSFGAVLAGAAALTLASSAGAWRGDGVPLAIVTVPQTGSPAISSLRNRGDAVAAALAGVPGLTARRLPAQELTGLLSPWLGDTAALPADVLPATFELRGALPATLLPRLAQLSPGTQMDRGPAWLDRARGAAGRWQAVALAGSGLVAGVASCLIAVAARAGLSGQRSIVETVHVLGGTDGMIAGHFALRIAWLSLAGALPGTLCALATLLTGAWLMSPVADEVASWTMPGRLPGAVWWLAACVPGASVGIAWVTSQMTVRSWLRRLP